MLFPRVWSSSQKSMAPLNLILCQSLRGSRIIIATTEPLRLSTCALVASGIRVEAMVLLRLNFIASSVPVKVLSTYEVMETKSFEQFRGNALSTAPQCYDMFIYACTGALDAHDAKIVSGFRTRRSAARTLGYEPPTTIQGVLAGLSLSFETLEVENFEVKKTTSSRACSIVRYLK